MERGPTFDSNGFQRGSHRAAQPRLRAISKREGTVRDAQRRYARAVARARRKPIRWPERRLTGLLSA